MIQRKLNNNVTTTTIFTWRRRLTGNIYFYIVKGLNNRF